MKLAIVCHSWLLQQSKLADIMHSWKNTQYRINVHFIPLLLHHVIEAGLLPVQTDFLKHFICLLISHTNN